jgi:hypothetical protein
MAQKQQPPTFNFAVASKFGFVYLTLSVQQKPKAIVIRGHVI